MAFGTFSVKVPPPFRFNTIVCPVTKIVRPLDGTGDCNLMTLLNQTKLPELIVCELKLDWMELREPIVAAGITPFGGKALVRSQYIANGKFC